MIKRTDLLALSFYEKSPFTGSDGQMNYRVEKTNAKGSEEKLLMATVWPGPLCFPLSSEESRQVMSAPFSEEGMEELVIWMNQKSLEQTGS